MIVLTVVTVLTLAACGLVCMGLLVWCGLALLSAIKDTWEDIKPDKPRVRRDLQKSKNKL